LIAAHNRSDGGIGAVMSATLEYQRVIAGQLMSLQEAMAEVLVRISSLSKELQTLIQGERLSDLHALFGRQIIRYNQEATSRAGSFRGDYTAWMEDNQTRRELGDISLKLSEAVSEVLRGRRLDAMTALYLPAAVYASLGVRAALGEDQPQLAVEAQRYVSLFDLIEDPAEPGSVASDLSLIAGEISQRTRELAKMGFIAPVEDAFDAQVVQLGRVAVQDYTPSAVVRYECEYVPRPGSNRDIPDRCLRVPVYGPARVGARESFGFFATITPVLVEARHGDAPAISIRQFQVEPKLSIDKVPDLQPPLAASDVSPSGAAGTAAVGKTFSEVFSAATRKAILVMTLAPTHNAEAPTTKDRQTFAKSTPQYAEAQAAQKRLSETVDNLNLLLARSVLNAAALSAVASTRISLFRYFGKGG
jgi:hypothetical protein